MSNVLAANVLANGLRSEFTTTYEAIRNRQSDSRLASVMNLSVPATNRQHEFAYFEAAPHAEHWPRGTTVPTDGFGSVQFTVKVVDWARRVKWHKHDRMDDQTQSLFTQARMAGESFGLLPERIFFDLILNTTSTLPAVPLAPDGAAMFATTAGGAARFGASSGNLLTGTGVASATTIIADYYTAIEQFMAFQDGKGQPMFSADRIDAGVVLIHGSDLTQKFHEAFYQLRQGFVYGSNTAAATPSNVVIDSSRNVELWGTSRLNGTNDFFLFLKDAPIQPTFILDRQAPQEFTALEGDNNSDSNRDTGQEYIQWEARMGGGIALPYAAIKVANS